MRGTTMRTLSLRTTQHTEFVNLDDKLATVIAESGVSRGFLHVFVPHTTAGITINENADPDVRADLIKIFERAVPWVGEYAHAEGNSAAHAKASMVGFHQAVFIEDGRMALGTWQSVFFCEFDGPRTRSVWVRVVPA